MRTLCACPRTLMPTIFVKQPLMPPTVHQIEYVRTNATKTQLSKTHKRTYETRDPQPARCKPMRIYAHTMRMPTSPCQRKLFNKSGLGNVQTILGFVCNALWTLAMQSCNRTTSNTTIKETSGRTNQRTNPWPIPCTSMRIYTHTMRVPTHPHANKIRETTPHAANRSPDRLCSHKCNQNVTFENT